MDWYTWLSKTSLEPSLVYEYGLAFAQNELEEDDVKHFNHEFLQSMGISIAKHRLEILKLVKKEYGGSPHRPMSRLMAALKRTKRCLSKYIHAWVHHSGDDTALVVVPKASYGARWRGAMLKRNKRLLLIKQGRLMVTDGSAVTPKPTISCGASPILYYDAGNDGKISGDEENLAMGVEEIRWASMFQDLKPT